MKWFDLYRRSLWAALICSIMSPVTVTAEQVILNPAYINGQGDVNGTVGQKVRSLSMSAYGGGYSSSKSVSQDYREPIIPLEYSLTVQGGDWETTVNATATASPVGSTYPYTTIYFSPRTISVPATEPPTTIENNDYTTDATVQFQLSLDPNSDPYIYWYTYAYAHNDVPAGQYSRSYARNNWCSDPSNCSWDMPVVANSANPQDPNDQGVRISAYVRVYGTHSDGTGYNQYYYFWWYSPDHRYEDIAPGDTLVIPLELTHKAPPEQEFETGSVQGNVDLGLVVDGIDYSHLLTPDYAHYVWGYGGQYVPENGGSYVLSDERVGLRTYRIRSWFDNWSVRLDWPYTDGDALNDRINVEANQVYTKDFSNVAGILTGQINLTGTLSNEDLNYYQLRAYGASDYLVDGSWERQPTYGGYSYDTVHSDDDDQSYRFFLTPGPWHPYYLQTYAYNELLGYTNYSQLRVYDYNHLYDGNYYDFGAPSEVLAGITTHEEDRSYCTGSLIVRFRIAGGEGQLRNPYLQGYANVYNEAGNREYYSNVWGYSYPPSSIGEPEVEVHGIPANYNINYVRATTDDGTQVRFPPIVETFECGVRKGRDLSGPEIVIAHPPFGLITNEEAIMVEGAASDDTGVDSININGNTVAFSLTGNPDVPNEVSYSYELAIENGVNTIRTTAVDVAGNESFDEREIYVDRWQPAVTITSPADGSYYTSLDGDIDLNVDASDQGYGFTLTVMLDGVVIGVVEGAANDAAPVSVSFTDSIGPLSVGNHQITAQVEDNAGNTSVVSSTITSYLVADVRAKPEARNNKEEGTSTIFVTLPDGLTATASLSIADNREISATPDQIPIDVKYSIDDDQLLLKFSRTPELMEDEYFEVEGLYCPNPSDPAECYKWRGSDTTNK